MTSRRLLIILLLSAALAPPMRGQFRPAPTPVELNAVPLSGSAPAGEKSVFLAGLLSAILPGTGEWYASDLGSGAASLTVDGLLWLSYGGMKIESQWIRDDARTYAAEHAGASLAGKDANFEVNIGNYSSMDAFNEAMLRNRDYSRVYSSPADQWNWQSDDLRSTYRGYRIRSDQWNSDAKFAIAGLVVNRILSVFSATRQAARVNRGLSEAGWNLNLRLADVGARRDLVALEFHTAF